MQIACLDVPESQVNKYASVRECWKLDELAIRFGVILVIFCVAKLKETTNMLASRWAISSINWKHNGSVIRATFLRHVVCFEGYEIAKEEASRTIYLSKSHCLLQLRNLNVQFEKKRNT